MTKILSGADINFGFVDEFRSKMVTTKIENAGTEKVAISDLVSNSQYFVPDFAALTLQAKFPINSTLYYGDANGKYCDANGSYYTTNQGFGAIGTTNAVGFLTPSTDTPAISITAPTALSKHKLSTAFNVVLSTANVALCNIILESESGGYKIYENLDCSSGSLTQSVQILASDGFSPNELIYIYARATIGTTEDSKQIQSIATLTLANITGVVATVAKIISGATNGATLNIYYKLHLAGSWTLSGVGTVDEEVGTWTYSLTIPTADVYDVRVSDGADADAYAQQDLITVAQNKLTGIVLAEVTTGQPTFDLVNIQNDFSGRNVLFTTASYTGQVRVTSNGDLICVCGIGVGFKIYSKTGTVLNTTALTSAYDAVMDATHLYVSTFTGTTITVRKYLLSDYSYVGATSNLYSNSDPYFRTAYSLCDGGSYVYLHGSYSLDFKNFYVRKILKSNLSVSATGNDSSNSTNAIQDIGIGGSTLYFFTQNEAVRTQPDTLAGSVTSTGRNGGDKFGFYVNSKVYSRKYGSATKIVEQLTNGTESDVYTSAGKDIMDASLILY